METNETLAANLLLAVSIVGGALNETRREMLSRLRPDEWIPADYVISFLSEIEANDPEKVRTIGRAMMYAGKSTFLKDLEPLSPTKVLQFMAQSFERTNRGPSIGYWKLLSFREGFAELETTDYSGEHFVEGLLMGAVRVAGGEEVTIEKRKARSRGDDCDLFAVSWEAS